MGSVRRSDLDPLIREGESSVQWGGMQKFPTDQREQELRSRTAFVSPGLARWCLGLVFFSASSRGATAAVAHGWVSWEHRAAVPDTRLCYRSPTILAKFSYYEKKRGEWPTKEWISALS